MSNKQELKLVTGEMSGEIALAVATIVIALKKQPAFNIEHYDMMIQRFLDKGEPSNIVRQILEATQEPKT